VGGRAGDGGSANGFSQTADIARERLRKLNSSTPMDDSHNVDTATADLESFMGELDSFIHGGAAPSANVQQQAQEEKAKGNRAFQQGDLATAERHYQRSLELWADNAAVYANRAQCRLKRGAAAAAEEDATRAVNLDTGYVKAYHRRALARVEQGNPSGALQGDFGSLSAFEIDFRVNLPMKTRRTNFSFCRHGTDFEKVLQLAPSTPGIRQEILAMKEAINEADMYIPPVQVPSAPHSPAIAPSPHVEITPVFKHTCPALNKNARCAGRDGARGDRERQ
jgi:tetratricopeptide (TPR) repeat protein